MNKSSTTSSVSGLPIIKSLLTILMVLLLSVTASAAEIVSKDITWSEYPVLSYIGIGDYIETATYSDGYQENTYRRGMLSTGQITGISQSVAYTIGQPEINIPIKLKGMSCTLGSYSYHTLQLYYQAPIHTNDIKITDKQLPGGIMCDTTVDYNLIVEEWAFGTKIDTPGTYRLEIREISWNDKGTQILEIQETNLVVAERTPFAEFKAETLVPSKFVITTSETISISSRIKNIGTQTATLPVELKVNNVYYSSQSVTLNAGESKTITFSGVKFPIAGNHKISILAQSNTIVVSGTTQPVPTPTPTPPSTGEGKISVTSDPSGATVRISSEEVGKTPISVYRSAGNYIIATSMTGYETDYYGVAVTSGNTVSHNVKLVPLPVGTPVPPAPPIPTPSPTPVIPSVPAPTITPVATPDIDTEVECYSGYIWNDTYQTCVPITETVTPSGDTTIYMIVGAVLITGIFLLTRKK